MASTELKTPIPQESNAKPLGIYSKDDVAQHNSKDDLWVIINENIFDLTEFQTEHPGGTKILQKAAGTDASKTFQRYHREAILLRHKERLQIGVLSPNPAKAQKKSSFFRLFKN